MLFALALAAAPACPATVAAAEYEPLPPCFKVSVSRETRTLSDKERFVCVETLTTTNEGVNRELAGIVRSMEEQYAGCIPPDERKLAWRNNRLDVEITWSRTGYSWLSVLVSARQTVQRRQAACPFTTRTYDLLTGRRIFLTDIFPLGSPAWNLLASRVRAHLLAVFPAQPRNTGDIETYCGLEALQTADFTLHGMELTLHYEARALFPGKTGLIHVRFFYPEFAGMMTEEGARQTDNSRYRMVALTADDGPQYELSTKTLNALRICGARVTFFTCGSLYLEGLSVLQREFDGNHIIANHSYTHRSGLDWDVPVRLRQLERSDAILLEFLGEPSPLFRAPGGVYPPWVEAKIGVPIVQWSVDSYDYTGSSARQIFCSVRDFVRDGDIVLLHDVSLHLHEAVPLICAYLDDQGFLTVSVEELAWANGIRMMPGVVYHRLSDGVYSERRDSNVN